MVCVHGASAKIFHGNADHMCFRAVAGQAAIRQAEVAYSGKKKGAAQRILDDNYKTLDSLQIWPDPTAAPSTLQGR